MKGGSPVGESTVTNAIMTEAQITEASTALTGAINTVVDTFIDMLPIIALTVGAVFAINFIKSRFRKVEKMR